MAAIMRRECPGLDSYAMGTHDRPMSKVISQAMDQAGIRPSQRMRKVSDYVLEQLIGEGPGYQDWQATHTQVTESKRRVRLYLVRTEATAEDRATIKVFNWQIGYRHGTTSTGVSRSVTATSHVDRLVEDAATAYMAPETLTDHLNFSCTSL